MRLLLCSSLPCSTVGHATLCPVQYPAPPSSAGFSRVWAHFAAGHATLCPVHCPALPSPSGLFLCSDEAHFAAGHADMLHHFGCVTGFASGNPHLTPGPLLYLVLTHRLPTLLLVRAHRRACHPSPPPSPPAPELLYSLLCPARQLKLHTTHLMLRALPCPTLLSHAAQSPLSRNRCTRLKQLCPAPGHWPYLPFMHWP